MNILKEKFSALAVDIRNEGQKYKYVDPTNQSILVSFAESIEGIIRRNGDDDKNTLIEVREEFRRDNSTTADELRAKIDQVLNALIRGDRQ